MPVRPLRLAPEWDDRFTRMVVVSAVAHAAVIVATFWVVTHPGDERPLPLVAYTVEITDPNALGGRLPPGAPGKNLTGGPTVPPGLQGRTQPPTPAPAEPTPEAKPPEPPPPAETKPPEPPPAEPKPPEPQPAEAKPAEPPPPPPEPKPAEAKPEPPKPEEPTVSLEKKPAPPPPEPKKVEPPKPEPKPQVAKPEPPKPAPEPKKPEPAKPTAAKAEPAKPPPGPTKPDAKAAASDAHAPTGKEAGSRDDYAAAAERWRARPDKQGGGLGGDGGSGPIGAGGEGPGGGGQLVGIEFLAYRQKVINTVKAQWTNVIARPGLVTAIRFEIGPNGEVGTIKVEKSSGNPAYDASATRAVQRANPLPAPPSKYAHEFGEFVIEFHSEEQGGQGAG